MVLHAKLQLSARRWRAPLWPVVLPLCDWLTGRGGVETSSFSLSSSPSLLSLPHSKLLHCTVWHLDQAACHSLCPCLFGTRAATFQVFSGNFTQSTSVFSPTSVWSVKCRGRGDVFIGQIFQSGLWNLSLFFSFCCACVTHFFYRVSWRISWWTIFSQNIKARFLKNCFIFWTSPSLHCPPHNHFSSSESTSCIWLMLDCITHIEAHTHTR